MSLENISNSELSSLINEWGRGERNRNILKRRLIDQICYEKLAEEFDLSVVGVKKIVYKQQDFLFRKISEVKPEFDSASAANDELAIVL